MANNNTTKVKAYLCEDGPAVSWPVKIKEVRMVIITDVTYALLRQKMRSLFPDLSLHNFVITWKDEDGDIITVSSDEEIQQALSFASGGSFKVYIKILGGEPKVTIPVVTEQVVESTPKVASTPKAESTPKVENATNESRSELPKQEVHPNIVCDGCNSSVTGPRFKCLSCDDYDLCQTCLNKNVHYDHDMIRIVLPSKLSASRHWFRPMQHIWQKLARHSAYYEKREEKIKAKMEHIREKHCKRGHGHHHRRMGKNVEQTDAANNATDSDGFNQELPPPYCDFGLGPGALFDFKDNLKKNSLLKTIGTSVANMLDPLGINVTIDVENSDGEIEPCASCTTNKDEKKQTGSSNPDEKATASEHNYCQPGGLFGIPKSNGQGTDIFEPLSIGKIVSSIHQMSEDFQRQLETLQPEERRNSFLLDRMSEVRQNLLAALLDFDMEKVAKTMDNAKPTEPNTVPVEKDSKNTEQAPPTVEQPTTTEPEKEQSKLTKENVAALVGDGGVKETGAIPKRSSSSESSVAVTSVPDETQEIPDLGWTMINKDASPVKENPTALPKASTSNGTSDTQVKFVSGTGGASMYPFLATSEDGDKLSMALTQMIHMGYSNEGEWLSALLKAKNGDIAAVLDVLHPNNSH